jgi:hypothetical protein
MNPVLPLISGPADKRGPISMWLAMVSFAINSRKLADGYRVQDIWTGVALIRRRNGRVVDHRKGCRRPRLLFKRCDYYFTFSFILNFVDKFKGLGIFIDT